MENLRQEQYSYADVLTWDEQERIELIYGEPRMMAPPKRIHQAVSMELSTQIASFLNGKQCKVFAAPFGVRLFEKPGDAASEVDTYVEPDITVVCDPKKLDECGCQGAPDLIIEILSDSTDRDDRVVKYQLYQKAGVKEYWIVDPVKNQISVYNLSETGAVPTYYRFDDKVKAGIYDDLYIDFSDI